MEDYGAFGTGITSPNEVRDIIYGPTKRYVAGNAQNILAIYCGHEY